MHKRFGQFKNTRKQITTWKDTQPVVIEEFGIIETTLRYPSDLHKFYHWEKCGCRKMNTFIHAM